MQKQIIKIGSDVTLNDKGEINIELLRNLASQIKNLEKESRIFTGLVFSGYVKSGKILTKDTRQTKDISFNELEQIIKVGKENVLEGIKKAFEETYDIEERLFTYDDLYLDQEHHILLKNIICDDYDSNWKKGILLATNYDDLRDKSEIKKDNDKFASYLAVTLGAKRLIILGENYEGLLEDVNNKNSLIRTVENIDDTYYDYCNGTSCNGTGGFYSKIEACDIATTHQIEAHIANARANLKDIIS